MSALQHRFTWRLDASTERVFQALVDSEELEQWFTEHAEVEPRVGGAYRFWGKHTYGTPSRADALQSITRFEPGRALAFTWRIHERDSLVSLLVEPDGQNASVVTGTHEFSEAPAMHRAAEMVDDLWRVNGGNLQAHLAGGQGKMLVDYGDAKPSVVLSIHIEAPPSTVFQALIDADKIQQWFGVAASVDPRVGGQWHLKMQYESDGEKRISPPCTILEYVENERLTISWPDWRGDAAVPDQRVAWTLKPEGTGTRVELVHDGFVRPVDVSDYPFGWGYFLSRIKAVAERRPVEANAGNAC